MCVEIGFAVTKHTRSKTVFEPSEARLLLDDTMFVSLQNQRQAQYFEGSQASYYVLLTLFLRNRKIADITTLQKAVFGPSDARLLSDDTMFI